MGATRNESFYEGLASLGLTGGLQQQQQPFQSGSGANHSTSASVAPLPTDRQSIRFTPTVSNSTGATTATVYPIQHHRPPAIPFEPILNLKNTASNILDENCASEVYHSQIGGGQFIPFQNCLLNNNNEDPTAQAGSMLSSNNAPDYQLQSDHFNQPNHSSNYNSGSSNNLSSVLSESNHINNCDNGLNQNYHHNGLGLLSPQSNQHLVNSHHLGSNFNSIEGADPGNNNKQSYNSSSPSNSSSSPFYYHQHPTQMFSPQTPPSGSSNNNNNHSNSSYHIQQKVQNVNQFTNNNPICSTNNLVNSNQYNSNSAKLVYNIGGSGSSGSISNNNLANSVIMDSESSRSYIDLTTSSSSSSKGTPSSTSYYYPPQQPNQYAQKADGATNYNYSSLPLHPVQPFHHTLHTNRNMYNLNQAVIAPTTMDHKSAYHHRRPAGSGSYQQLMYPPDPIPKPKQSYSQVSFQFPEHIPTKRMPPNYNYSAPQPNSQCHSMLGQVGVGAKNYGELYQNDFDHGKSKPNHLTYQQTNGMHLKHPLSAGGYYAPLQYDEYRSSQAKPKSQYSSNSMAIPNRSGYNIYPNGFHNYPMNYSHPQMNTLSSNNSSAYPSSYPPSVPQSYQSSPDFCYPSQYQQSHPSYPKVAPASAQQKPIENLDGSNSYLSPKFNRPCYYENSAPDKIPYIDLEEQINSSKIPKTRTLGYPNSNVNYHHPHNFAQPQFYQTTGGSSSKYGPNHGKERFPYTHQLPMQSQHYLSMPQGSLQHHHHPHLLTMDGYNLSQHHLQASHQMPFEDSSKKINLRDFLTSWNDDEEESAAFDPSHLNVSDYRYPGFAKVLPCGQGHEKDPGLGKTQRIQVGISIDKNDQISASSLNLPDIIIDIEKQQQKPHEGDCEEGNERLYVLESIDVPISELNKYKHLSVINKLPENIIHMEGEKEKELKRVVSTEIIDLDLDDSGGSKFNENELIDKTEEFNRLITGKEGESSEKASPGLENSMKFIEEIESNSDFKNDFELNVEYENFHLNNLKSRIPQTGDRKESVIVANRVDGKAGFRKKRKRMRIDEANQMSDDEGVNYNKKRFNTLVKCCLDVINTKEYRRNGGNYLGINNEKPKPCSVEPKPIEYKYTRRKCFKSPPLLRDLCENILSHMSLIAEVPVAENVEVESEKQVEIVPSRLRDLCEEVLRHNHYIINVDELLEVYYNADDKPTDENNNKFCLINLLTDNTVDGSSPVSIIPEDQEVHCDETDETELTSTYKEQAQNCDILENDVDNDDLNVIAQSTELMDCDYFLEEVNNSIQCEEEIIPIDIDRHRRDTLTESMRMKYARKASTKHSFNDTIALLARYQRFTLIQSRLKRKQMPAKLTDKYKTISHYRRKYGKKAKTIVHQQVNSQTQECIKSDKNRGLVECSTARKRCLDDDEARIYTETALNLITKPLNVTQHNQVVEVNQSQEDDRIEDEQCPKYSAYRAAVLDPSKGDDRGDLERAISSRLSARASDCEANLTSEEDFDNTVTHLESAVGCRKTVEIDVKAACCSNSDSDIDSVESQELKPTKKYNRKVITKKVKQNFDEILLGIDNIYKNDSKSRIKPRKISRPNERQEIEVRKRSSGRSSTDRSSTSSSSAGGRSKRSKNRLKLRDYSCSSMLNAKSKVRINPALDDQILTKQAVVQLERDGYIDKLGKLYT